jgi:hypothetical protein
MLFGKTLFGEALFGVASFHRFGGNVVLGKRHFGETSFWGKRRLGNKRGTKNSAKKGLVFY